MTDSGSTMGFIGDGRMKVDPAGKPCICGVTPNWLGAMACPFGISAGKMVCLFCTSVVRKKLAGEAAAPSKGN